MGAPAYQRPYASESSLVPESATLPGVTNSVSVELLLRRALLAAWVVLVSCGLTRAQGRDAVLIGHWDFAGCQFRDRAKILGDGQWTGIGLCAVESGVTTLSTDGKTGRVLIPPSPRLGILSEVSILLRALPSDADVASPLSLVSLGWWFRPFWIELRGHSVVCGLRSASGVGEVSAPIKRGEESDLACIVTLSEIVLVVDDQVTRRTRAFPEEQFGRSSAPLTLGPIPGNWGPALELGEVQIYEGAIEAGRASSMLQVYPVPDPFPPWDPAEW